MPLLHPRVATALAFVGLGVAALALTARAQTPAGVAYLALDLTTNRATALVQAEQIDTPIAPGSVVKIATLAAALESGVITPQSGILCTRQITVGGHVLTCAHPDLHRPLKASEALAYSCNVYFATLAARLPRSAFDDALVRLGLPRSSPGVSLPLAALGLEGVQASPRRLLDMLVKVAAEPNQLRWQATTLATLREGLRGAATTGTASALGMRGIDALAKTGTVLTANGPRGIVAGVTPARSPTTGFVLLASGAAGMDAAALAAERIASQRSSLPPPSPISSGQTLRVGFARAGGGYTVRPMSMEEYVAEVLAGEAAPNSSAAALDALAITIRTYATANLGRHDADGFDVCDLTHCQVLRKATAATLRSADSTAGRLLLYKGAPASVFYHASCGGYTERPSDVWPGSVNPPYLPSKPDDACEGTPAWTADLSATDLTRALRSAGFRGDTLRDLAIMGRDSSHRVARLRLTGFVPSEISGPDFRTIVGRTLGWQHLKSTAFELKRQGSGYHFDGHGSGHGVGLCVIGSARLAARGQSADAILARYFPGLTISAATAIRDPIRRVDRPAFSGVTLSLPEGDQEERDVVVSLAIRARDSLAKTLGLQPPPQLSLRFYPTVESYQRATGKPWFTSGASNGTQMHFIPLTVLRQRGIIEQTVRHEMVHALTEQALAGRPLWVREGAASYYSGEARGDRVAGGCPTDRELLQPVSAGALGLAYQRAAGCFADQILAGTAWRDIAR